ncbi:hypothetical protein FLGE108171_09045 [Flavobacterium gelidilacus]|uniref:hypothetical protein n=1 Tax=Flavobacterium gelidilacus TaxID=206041 RepID=UPI0006876B5B|nr:hypothetical protein [Flavobacterium gelidilacus]
MTKFKLLLILFFSSLTIFGQDSLPKANGLTILNKDSLTNSKGWKINNKNKIILKSDNPLLILNGNLVDYELMNDLDPQKIESLNVIKGEASISKYGEKGKHGSIEITSKDISKKELAKLYKLYAYSYEPNTKGKNKIIAGKITDCEKNPLKISIENLNSKKITYSDSLGNYTIETHKDDVLLYSRFGSISQRILIENQKVIDISLKKNPENKNIIFKKPVIYLYPKEKTEITLTLDFKGKLLTTFPKYDKNWKVIAEPNGQLFDTKTKRNYSSLFWDGDTSFEPEHYQYENGFVVEKDKLTDFLIEKLEYIGLNTTETNEFVQFWLPILEQNNYNFIHFLVNDACNEVSVNKVNPKPETSIRVYMEFYGLETTTRIKEQILPTIERKGFTLVEWGGADISDAMDLSFFKKLNKLPEIITFYCKRRTYEDTKPLYIINNAIASKKMFDNLKPFNIKKIEYISSEKGAALYGSDGIGGVFVVETK